MTHLIESLLVFLILSKCEDVFGEKPSIVSDTEEWYINEGERLEITCLSKGPVKFIYPQDEEEMDQIIVTSPIHETSMTISEEQIMSILTREKTVYGDTGYYGCADRDVNVTRGVYSQTDVSWIYVYVESKDHFFVAETDNPALYPETNIGDTLVLPCRPTSPNYTVTLIRGMAQVVELGENVVFDPRVGFTIKRVNQNHGGYHDCYITVGDTTQILPYHIIANNIVEISPPTICCKESFQYLTRGDTLRVNCSASLPKKINSWQLLWIVPHNDSRVSEEGHMTVIDYETRNLIQVLQINNITDEDQGKYTCEIRIPLNKKSTAVDIILHDSNKKFLILKPQNPKMHYQLAEGDNVTWVVHFEAFPPLQTIGWFRIGSSAVPIHMPHGSRYTMKNSTTSITLIIENLNLSDMGIYQLQANNGHTIETLNFTLWVTSKPWVDEIMPNKSYFMPNSPVNMTCRAVGFPAPNITWTFQPHSAELERHPKSEEQRKMTTTISNATLSMNTSGELYCSACNVYGCDSTSHTVVLSEVEGGFGLIQPQPENVTAGDDLRVTCAAPAYNFTDKIEWQYENDSIVITSGRIEIIKEQSPFTHQSTLHINPVEKSDDQTFTCRVSSNTDIPYSTVYTLKVYDPSPPTFLDTTNLNETENIYTAGVDKVAGITLKCYAGGMPKPVITWWKDGVPIKSTHEWSERDYDFREEDHVLIIAQLLEVVSGTYTCKAENRNGKIETFQRITVKAKEISIGVIIFVVILMIVMLILLVFFCIKVHRERVLRKQLMEAGLTHFEEGAVECLNPDLTVDDQAELLPYDKKWEFPIERLKFGKILGSGAFGVVMKAEARGIDGNEDITIVAVKKVKGTTEPTFIRALASELKIMVHLGKHLNVVNLLGACTKNIAKKELLVIVEYCRYGNLHNYLLRHRSEFINQIDSETGKIDLRIGSEILRRSSSIGSNNSLSVGSGNSDSVTCTQGLDSQGVTMSPDGMILSNNSIQPGWRSNYKGDYKDSNLKPICTQDLLSWAFQVARGMEYLSQRKVLHGDLAARNILLAEDNIVKICDFGLAKTMYKDDNYKKKGDAPLPIKWMAIESIRDRIFSTQSDVWSFGIVLWEFFTLANAPYHEIEAEKLYERLIRGYRMEKPEFATQEVYNIMLQCWKANPMLRPTFTDLVNSIGHLMEDRVKMHYLELNTPYRDMNTTIGTDYLIMMSAPDHEALSSPTLDYENSSIGNSYICMSPTSGKDSNIFSPRGNSENGHFQFPSPQKEPANCDSDSEAVELSPMLKSSDDDNYLKPINVQERRAEFARQRQAMKNSAKDNSAERDSGYCNTPRNLKFLDRSDVEIHDEVDNRRDSNKFTINDNYIPEIISEQVNYVNMIEQKNDLRKDASDSYTNPSYVLMTKELGQTEV